MMDEAKVTKKFTPEMERVAEDGGILLMVVKVTFISSLPPTSYPQLSLP